jgi:hypothetical protein
MDKEKGRRTGRKGGRNSPLLLWGTLPILNKDLEAAHMASS